MQDRLPRKLAAILYADVAGYSRLTGVDEEGTHRRLSEYLDLITGAIEEHRGRVVHYAGDAVLADFSTVTEALVCASSIQRELATRNRELPDERKVQFRIGVNLGEVIVDRDDIYGDGVNVAARLESLADPGGICISDAVRSAVGRKLDLDYEDMGEREAKNIVEPVRVYKVMWREKETAEPFEVYGKDIDGKARPAHVRGFAGIWKKPWMVPVLPVLLLVIGISFGWYLQKDPSSLRDKISITVMPLSTIGTEESTRRLADGLTADIVTDLSRFGELEIIDLNTAAAYKEKRGDLGVIGKELGVSYLLEGTVQHEGNRMRISAQLVDLASGTNLWGQRWDRPDQDAFAVQTELAEQVAATLGSTEASGALTASEIRKAKTRSPASLQAYDFYLLAVEQLGKFTEQAIQAGMDFASKAIALDPNFARPYAVRARLHFNSTHYGVDYEQAMQAMEADARKAVELDPSGPEPRAALAWYYYTRGRNKDAEVQLRSALELNPANITLIKMAAAVFASSGHPEEGAQLADKVLKLDPLATAGTLNTIKDAYFFARRFEDAVAVISRVPPDARSKGARLFLAFSLAFLGREEDARRVRAELLAAHPNISAELLLNQGWAFDREEDMKLFLDGFAAIDLPMCASDGDLAKTETPRRLPECPAA